MIDRPDASGASLRVVAAVSLLEDALRSWQLSNGRHERARVARRASLSQEVTRGPLLRLTLPERPSPVA